MAALRRARHRLADTPDLPDQHDLRNRADLPDQHDLPEQDQHDLPEPDCRAADTAPPLVAPAFGRRLMDNEPPADGAENADAPAEAGLRERGPGDGQYWRLLPGLLPASPFLPPGDLVVVDVETTGWLADEAGITEIGAVRLSPGRPTAEFSALVNPGMPIPAHITELTGITDAMVAEAPAITEVLPDFLRIRRRRRHRRAQRAVRHRLPGRRLRAMRDRAGRSAP